MRGYCGKDFWTIHSELDSDGYTNLCVYETRKQAMDECKGRDHQSRVVKFIRVERGAIALENAK